VVHYSFVDRELVRTKFLILQISIYFKLK